MRRSGEHGALVHGIARTTLALAWVYHDLWPKLLGPHPDEIRMIVAHGLGDEAMERLIVVAGSIEVLFGLFLLVSWTWRWPLALSAGLLAALLLDVALFAPEYLPGAFNPVSTNGALIALSVIALLTTGSVQESRSG